MIAELLGALKARWRIELAIFLAVMLIVGIWTWLSPRTYQASSSLLYDIQSPQPVSDRASSNTDDALLGTQADIIRSKAIAAAVVRQEGLATAPEVVANWRRATGGSEEIDSWVGEQISGRLTVVPEKGTRVLKIQYSSPSPDFAAQIANAFAVVYMKERLRLQTDPARTYTRWFEERTSDVRENLVKAQNKLAAFQRESGIVDTGTLNSEAGRLTDLSSQVVGAESAAADVGARASGGGQSQDVQSNGVVQGLRAQVATKSAQVSQMATVYGPNHPELIAARAELGALQSKLASETGSSTRSLDLASGAASARAANLRAKLEAQRGRMLSQVGARSQLEILTRDVASAQAAYDAVAQRLTAMRLQSEVPSTNVMQLDQARPPLLPSDPNVPLRIILGVLLGGMLAVGVGLLLEWWRPQVRTIKGLNQIAGVPVLALVRFDRPALPHAASGA